MMHTGTLDTHDMGHMTQETGHRIQNTDTGHRTPDTGHKTQDTGHRIPLAFRYLLPALDLYIPFANQDTGYL